MKIKYRPEIDGLRTIAVLSVIIYHAEYTFNSFKILKGGFFGVDIFFVISGFLITSLIINEYQNTKRFSFINFYERRARRLLPALITVMLASMPAAWIILLPTQFTGYLESLIASLFFGSNLYWHITLQEYGTESSLLKPFLHTWSLAVEEQFYILYPLFLIFILKWFRQKIIFLLFTLSLISLVFAQYMTLKNVSLSFYLLPSRIWELLGGGIIAIALNSMPNQQHSEFAKRYMPIFGIILILFSLFFIQFESYHPGLITLLPVVGTLLIIWFSNSDDIVTSVLRSKIFVAIGLISYSLYLWHYPIFAFGRIIDPTPSDLSKFVWICITFLFSVVTYYIVEIPFRRKKVITFKPLVGILAGSFIFIISFSAFGIQKDGLKERHKDLLNLYGKNEFDNTILRRKSWTVLSNLAKEKGYGRSFDGKPSEYEKAHSWFSTDENKIKILVVGNSHSKDLFNALHQNSENFPNHEFARFAMRGKIPDDQIPILLNSPNFRSSDIIVISFRYTEPTIARLPKLIQAINQHGKLVKVTSNTAEFSDKDKLPLFDWNMRNNTNQLKSDALNKLFYENFKSDIENINQTIAKIAEQNSAFYLDKYSLICDDEIKKCTGVTPEGYKSFYDYGHWTLEGAKHFGRRIKDMQWF